MLKLLILLITFLISTQAGVAEDINNSALLEGHVSSQELIVRRGCCSWHNGVCGCRVGRVLCCDGTLSPTCECLKDETDNESSIGKTLSCEF